MKTLFSLIVFLLLAPLIASAQSDPITQARIYTGQKEYAKAIDIYEKLYTQNPIDKEVYTEYLNNLIAAKEYKAAEQLVDKQQKVWPSPMLFVDRGMVYEAMGKNKKANEQFDLAVTLVNGDDRLTNEMANAFIAMKQTAYAIKVYEKGKEILRVPYLYNATLARLYAKVGDIGKAIDALMELSAMPMVNAEDTKATLLELLGGDEKKLQLAQKTLVKKINEQPENTYYAELLTWLYTQRGDWEGALIQIEAIDARNKENGQRLIAFAQTAKREKQYDIALKALNEAMELSKGLPINAAANAELLSVMMTQLATNPFYKKEDVVAIEKAYSNFFEQYPQYYNTETLRDYATIEAQYADNPTKAIALLQKALAQPGARHDFAGWTKLQLGDYYILTGKIWDASLLYSQVDKDFKEDQLGEEARFRNGKLAYYRGDFEWAQGQLSVLKASTAELIANDALYLSILITENIPPDSNLVPLRRFAYANLLLFQNKDKEAEALLDSLTQAFPKHPLNDDILMLRARLAIKHRDYKKALAYFEIVFEQYGKDVLADDAIFKTAEVYELYLQQPTQAEKYYEQLILAYPGSSLVQTARQKIMNLTAAKTAQPK